MLTIRHAAIMTDTKNAEGVTRAMCVWVGQSCSFCGFTLPTHINPSEKPVYSICPGQSSAKSIVPQVGVDHRTMGQSPSGAGSVLERWFEAWGVAPCQRCRKTAYAMNVKGSDWCEEHIEYLTNEILANAKANSSLKMILVARFPDIIHKAATRKLIKAAIKESRSLERAVQTN